LIKILDSLTQMKTTVTAILQKYQPEFHHVVSFDPEKDRLLLLDFTKKNEEISEELVNNTQLFGAYINQKLRMANAKFGIGGYNEYRELYSRSRVFDPDSPSVEGGKAEAEPRRLHLGTDIWGKPYTAVMSPCDGLVHSFAFNNRFGDYGATLILSHNIEEVSFHTLYGHLSLNSIKNFREGENVRNGDVIGEFGIPMENGQWPPHLHFQVIEDMEDWRGDYPGVCSISEKEKFLNNCPDPDLMLQMMRYAI
jgi:peptidoglycan LD-endopeptidase LytH